MLNKLYVDQYAVFVRERLRKWELEEFREDVEEAVGRFGREREAVVAGLGLGVEEAEEEVRRECFGGSSSSEEEEEEEEEGEEDRQNPPEPPKKLIEVIS